MFLIQQSIWVQYDSGASLMLIFFFDENIKRGDRQLEVFTSKEVKINISEIGETANNKPATHELFA